VVLSSFIWFALEAKVRFLLLSYSFSILKADGIQPNVRECTRLYTRVQVFCLPEVVEIERHCSWMYRKVHRSTENYLDTVEVAGSSPVVPTILSY